MTNKGKKEYEQEYKDEFHEAKEIKATSPESARQQFEAQATSDFDREADYGKSSKVNKVVVTGVSLASSYSASSEADVQMKAVKFPKYHFIPSDDQLLKMRASAFLSSS